MAVSRNKGKKPKVDFNPKATGKNPKSVIDPATDKTPRIALFGNQPLSWRFSSAARSGPYSWLNLTDPDKFKKVMERLTNFETMSWQSILGSGSHPIAVSNICREAQKDLLALQHDDLDELMSFRITGGGRVWGRLHLNIIHILWWDPEHLVYPVDLKHT